MRLWSALERSLIGLLRVHLVVISVALVPLLIVWRVLRIPGFIWLVMACLLEGGRVLIGSAEHSSQLSEIFGVVDIDVGVAEVQL